MFKRMLFYPGHGAKESNVFTISSGEQITVAAFGLSGSDNVTFEMVLSPAMNKEICKCPPYTVELPSVSATEQLRCCSGIVAITQQNPFIILDAPQNILLRAVLNTSDASDIYVWAVESKTPGVTERMRGCPCGE